MWLQSACLLLLSTCCLGGPTQLAASSPAADDWARLPMPQLTQVTLAVEEGGVAQSLRSLVPELRKELNIELEVSTGPFEQEAMRQYRALIGQTGQFQIVVQWPTYVPDFAPYLTPLSEVPPGGASAVARDLELQDVHPAYRFCHSYRGEVIATQLDGDVKLLHYRRDLIEDGEERAAFRERYGYEIDMADLTWDNYRDLAQFFTRPEEQFYGTAEIGGFFSYFTFMDRYVGSGLHIFDYEDMHAFPDREGTLSVLTDMVECFEKFSPPNSESLEFDGVRRALWIEQCVFMIPMWPDGWRWANNQEASEVAGKVGVTLMPGHSTVEGVVHRPDMNGGRVAMIPRSKKSPEAAYKVLAYFSRREVTHDLLLKLNWIDPWRKSHLAPEIYTEIVPDLELCRNYVETIDASTAQGYPGLQIPATGKYHEIIERWVRRALSGEETPEDIYVGLVAEMDAVTDSIGRDNQLAAWRAYVDDVLKPLSLYP